MITNMTIEQTLRWCVNHLIRDLNIDILYDTNIALEYLTILREYGYYGSV